jgi:hypothetical protein
MKPFAIMTKLRAEAEVAGNHYFAQQVATEHSVL